jgi:hypothetical protein
VGVVSVFTKPHSGQVSVDSGMTSLIGRTPPVLAPPETTAAVRRNLPFEQIDAHENEEVHDVFGAVMTVPQID